MQDSLFLDICRKEYHALIEMLNDTIEKCPSELWNKEINEPPFWQQIYHTVFYLDFYLGEDPDKHKERFNIKENLNEKMEKTLSKEELSTYLNDTKKKCDALLSSVTSEKLEGKNKYYWTGPTQAHKLIYNIRHSQHHIGKLVSILRRYTDDTTKWVITPKE